MDGTAAATVRLPYPELRDSGNPVAWEAGADACLEGIDLPAWHLAPTDP